MNQGLPESKLLSINTSLPRSVPVHGELVETGIFKRPVNGTVMLRRLNLDGDAQADLGVHGGVDKAVYVYSAEHYDSWNDELGRRLTYGQFGENLTVTGLLESTVHFADVLAVGEAVLQVTQPRSPCYKLGIAMGDQGFLKRFLESGRSGFYCRVLTEGVIEAGDAVSLLARIDGQPTIRDLLQGGR